MAATIANLSPLAERKIKAFIANTARAYGAESGAMQFTIEPSMLQSLNELMILDGSSFLQQINVVPVGELKGEKIFLNTPGLVTGRALIDDTHERVPIDPSDLSNKQYELFGMESDVALAWAKIDTWAKFPNFVALWNQTVRKAIANDRVKIGWNGESAADVTNKSTHPNGEDIAPGWLEQIRGYSGGAQYVDGTGEVVLSTVEFPNLDYLVSITKARVDIIFRNDPDLVAFISQDLATFEEQQYYYKVGRKPEQKTALQANPDQLMRNYGGLPSYSIPFMPAGTVLVSSYKNLSIYYQDTSWRRMIRDHAPKKRYEDFTSRNEGFVVEDFRKASLLQGVTISQTPLVAE